MSRKSEQELLQDADERFEDGDVAGALALLERLLARHPELAEAYFNRASYRAAGGDAAGALADLDQYRARAGDDADSHALRGQLAIGRRDYDGALAHCSDALKLEPDRVDALINRGICSLETRDFAAALADYQRVIALEPEHAAGHCGLAEALVGLGRLDEALPALTAAVARDPEYVDYARSSASLAALRVHPGFEAALAPAPPPPRPGCAVCRASALGHYGNGVLLADSLHGLRKLSPPVDGGWDYDALFVCPACGAYRRLGSIEASKDYHAVWLPIERAADLAPFMNDIAAEAVRVGVALDALVAQILARAVYDVG